jgi:hypothetical protein
MTGELEPSGTPNEAPERAADSAAVLDKIARLSAFAGHIPPGQLVAALRGIGALSERMTVVGRVLNEQLRPLTSAQRGIDVWMRRMQAQLEPITRAVGSLPRLAIDWGEWWKEHRKSFMAAAEMGWFPQPETGLDVLRLDANGNLVDDFDQRFTSSLRSDLAEVESRLVNSFPARRHLITEGFALHREGRYVAAIPLILNCAEGIVQESTNESPFSIKGTAPEVAQWIRPLPLERRDQLAADVLLLKHPLNIHAGDSRHRINHGRSLGYGTEFKSLSAISFLGFVGWLFCPHSGLLTKAAQEAGWKLTAKGWRPDAISST